MKADEYVCLFLYDLTKPADSITFLRGERLLVDPQSEYPANPEKLVVFSADAEYVIFRDEAKTGI